MDFFVSVAIFSLSLIISLIKGISIIIPLLTGMVLFSFTAFRRGYSLRSIFVMNTKGMKKALQLMPIFALIGIITAAWRASGTIPFLVYYGTKFMNPDYFILFAFYLTCLVSFALGTSLGTAGTIGVVLMVLAKGGNVNVNAAAGAIISGAYFGDRCSPTSSSANLVATITGTNLYDNVKKMMVTGLLPFVAASIFYLILSKQNPVKINDSTLLNDIAFYFNLNVLTILPALIIFVFAIFKMNVKTSMLFSILTACLICVFVQKMAVMDVADAMLFGFELESEKEIAKIISGGGLFSMLKVALIVLIASSYSGIFEETKMLDDIQGVLEKTSNKIGTYMTTLLISITTSIFCCNQTLPVLLTHQLMDKIYAEKGLSDSDIAIDIENTAILIPAVIPWSIAIAVPLATLSVTASSIPYAVYLFFVPLINIFKFKNIKHFKTVEHDS